MSGTESNPFGKFKNRFDFAGSKRLHECPVCESKNFVLLWQLPQVPLPEPGYLYYGDPQDRAKMRGGAYIRFLPLLTTPQRIFRYDLCTDCGSVFRNPTVDDQAIYRSDPSKVKDFEARGVERFRQRTKYIAGFMPDAARVIVDAACGAGQTLTILKEGFPEARLVALEISEPAVAHMKAREIEAYVVDLDVDDLDHMVAPGSADYVVFSESFEHVRSPITVLRKLVRLLRPGGRLYYSAQYYGEQTNLQIRVGEPIYIGVDFRDTIPSLVGCKLHNGNLRDGKVQDVLEKI